MAGQRLIDAAVTGLASMVASNFATYARALETQQGLAVNTLPDLVAVVAANNPDDVRSPLVEVFDAAARCVNNRTNEWELTCTIALSFAGDADTVANELMMRRYTTVMIDTLRHDVTLGGAVTAMSLRDYSSDVLRGGKSATRYVFAFGVVCDVKDT
jgi:hypothetical protein